MDTREELKDFMKNHMMKLDCDLDVDTITDESGIVNIKLNDTSNTDNTAPQETSIEVHFDEYGRLETNSMEVVNQEPEFFKGLIQKIFNENNIQEDIDLNNEFDSLMMEAIAERILESAELDIHLHKIKRNTVGVNFEEMMEFGDKLGERDMRSFNDIEVNYKSSQVAHIDDEAPENNMYQYNFNVEVNGEDKRLSIFIKPDNPEVNREGFIEDFGNIFGSEERLKYAMDTIDKIIKQEESRGHHYVIDYDNALDPLLDDEPKSIKTKVRQDFSP